MAVKTRLLFEFGPFRLDPTRHQLWRGWDSVALTPKLFDTLLVLVKAAGQTVTKDELLQTVWPDTFVEEASLAQNIFQLRKVLAAGDADHVYIKTIPKRGYRFAGAVRTVEPNSVHEDLFTTRNGTGAQALSQNSPISCFWSTIET